MKRIAIWLTIVMLWLVHPAVSAESTNHRKAVDELFKVLKIKQQTESIVGQSTQMAIKKDPNLAPYKETLRLFYSKYLGWENLENDLAKLYMSHLSEQELKEIIAFYRTATGQKALIVLPELLAKTSQIQIQSVQAHLGEFQQMVAEKEKQLSKASTPILFKKPANSKGVHKSKKGFVELWVDETKWKPTTQFDSKRFEFQFAHTSEDLYGAIIAERSSMPMASLEKFALVNLKKTAPDAKAVFKEYRLVNGTKIVCLQLNGTLESGLPITYYGYYWSGQAGMIQLITFTGQNIFTQFKYDMTDFLNGLVITKP